MQHQHQKKKDTKYLLKT